MSVARRIILNTSFLYVKILITMAVLLYSTRLVLNALGVEDFGLFNLVAGVIAMLSFLNIAMTASSQRYLSYYIGSGDTEKIKSVFKSSVHLHIIIGILMVVILELLGLFIFNGFLNISTERVYAAKIVFQCMVFSTFFTINAVPYDAVIEARENMFFDSVIGISESFGKLLIAIILLYSNSDRLILYGLLLAFLTIIVRILKIVYCKIKYQECRGGFGLTIEKSLIKEMSSFAKWNLFGSLGLLVKGFGIGIVLNLFFGTIINATYGIANQVNTQVSKFSMNMLKALNPQIVKSEGGGDRNRMISLALMACKWGFYLLSFFAIPLLFEMNIVLQLWLKIVPQYTVIFCQLILLASLTYQLTIGLQTAIQATGKIKIYQSVIGSLLLINIPISFLLLYFNYPPYSPIIMFIVTELIAGCFRIYFAYSLASMSIKTYFQEVIIRIFVPLIISVLLCYSLYCLMPESYSRLIITVLCSSVLYVSSIYIFGLKKEEKEMVIKLSNKVKNKVFN